MAGSFQMIIFRRRTFCATLFSLFVSMGCFTTGARAECADFVLSCDNGRDYPFCPRAISPVGDVVTGTLTINPHAAVKLRLIPMGVGYRYAGRGIWFDGFQNAAQLFLRKDLATACTVTRQTLDPASPVVLYTKG
jgi:hypothetical protein